MKVKVKKTPLKKSFLILPMLCLAFSLFSNTSAFAVSVIADTPCDALYYESLSSRAWLEAQREITQNQNLILKPDSVFEYTCFNRLVSELAAHGTSGMMGGPPLQGALSSVVGASLSSYISNNYSVGNLLGGHPAAAGVDHNETTISTGLAYTCDIMDRVWKAAKCINFISTPLSDGFFTFQEYTTHVLDKRPLPSACMPITTNWTANLATALTTGPWTNDPVQTYFAETEPQATCAGNCPCDGDPIPTGITVIRPELTPLSYEEHICLQPGCRYHPGGSLTASVTAPAGCYGR